MKKKIVAMCATIALAAVAVTGGTLAYFTDTEEALNEFTVGNVEIELTEPGWAYGGSFASDVYPGQVLAKDPIVTNVGDNSCFVRVSVDGLKCLGEGNLIVFRTGNVANELGAGWEQVGDYYYYTQALEPGAATTKLFEDIVIPTTLTNGDGATLKTINVTADAVQSQGSDDPTDAAGIAAWFATCLA